jgi:hypothetical protein
MCSPKWASRRVSGEASDSLETVVTCSHMSYCEESGLLPLLATFYNGRLFKPESLCTFFPVAIFSFVHTCFL